MNTQTNWQFTPDEFAWLWASETGGDEVPYPISIIESRATADEYRQLQREIAARYPQHADPDLTGPLRVLASPDLRVISWGRIHRSDKRVRALAAAVGQFSVVLHQQSGPTSDFGGNLKMVVTARNQLGRHLAATLPDAEPGKLGPLSGYTPRVRGEEPPSSWLRNTDGKRPVEERIRLLMRAPRAAEGYLRVEGGLNLRRSDSPRHISWIDINEGTPAAGRYVVEVNNNDTSVTPVSTDSLAQRIQLHIPPENT